MPPKKIIPSGLTKTTRKVDEPKKENEEEQEEDNELNEINYAKNLGNLKRMRTYSVVMTGMTAGIFGIEGLHGFLYYFLMFFVCSLCLFFKTGFNVRSYFRNQYEVFYSGWASDLTLYVMLWVISHNLVYVL